MGIAWVRRSDVLLTATYDDWGLELHKPDSRPAVNTPLLLAVNWPSTKPRPQPPALDKLFKRAEPSIRSEIREMFRPISVKANEWGKRDRDMWFQIEPADEADRQKFDGRIDELWKLEP